MSTLSRGRRREGRTPTPATIPVRPAAAAAITDPTQRIRERAFQIFLSRAGAPGDALADWLQAERELGLSPRPGPARGAPDVSSATELHTAIRGEVLLHSDE